MSKQEIELNECPLWGGKHKWSIVFCKHSDGKVWYCQFCFIEKLIHYDNEDNGWKKKYFAKGSYYERTIKKKKNSGSMKTNEVSETTKTQSSNSISKNQWDEE